jgi:hypothetical protein
MISNSLLDINAPSYVPSKLPSTCKWMRLVARTIIDLPAHSRKTLTKVLVLSTMRSGSKPLCELLARTRVMGTPSEYSNKRLLNNLAEIKPRPSFVCSTTLGWRLSLLFSANGRQSPRFLDISNDGAKRQALIDLDSY